MTNRIQLCLSVQERHDEGIKSLSERTGYNKSELVRRMLDHCFQSTVLNELIPSMSGGLNLKGGS